MQTLIRPVSAASSTLLERLQKNPVDVSGVQVPVAEGEEEAPSSGPQGARMCTHINRQRKQRAPGTGILRKAIWEVQS